MATPLKLKALIEGFGPMASKKKEWTTEEKKAALEMIGRYNEYGQHLRRRHNLMEIAETLGNIADAAERFTMNETEDWFDKNTVKRHVTELKVMGSLQRRVGFHRRTAYGSSVRGYGTRVGPLL